MDKAEERVAEIVAARSAEEPLVASNETVEEAVAPEPNKGGRPRKYNPAMLDEVLLSAAKGATWEAIGEACGIDPMTAKDWCDKTSPRYSEAFSIAVTRARNKADDVMLTSLYTSGIGYTYEEQALDRNGRVQTLTQYKRDPGSAKSWLANRIGWSGETQNVNVNNVTPIVDDIPSD